IENQEKHSKIAKFVEKCPKSAIYTNFVEEAQKLKELLSAYLITGETSKKEREEILSKQDRPLVITSALSEGADLNQYQCLILATIPSSIIKFKQVVGRINRISQKGNKLIYVLVLDEYNQKMLKLLKERKKLDEMLKRVIRNYLIRNQNFRNATPKMRNENKYSLKEPV
ncbi:MAG: helicase-related protein, partial [Candidatus Aenigmatarchaeota archaeon]